jgi:hypothetical protein
MTKKIKFYKFNPCKWEALFSNALGEMNDFVQDYLFIEVDNTQRVIDVVNQT